MTMRIIELKITEEDELLGFEATALVNQPAHEGDFHAFSNEQFEEFVFESILEEILEEEKDGVSHDFNSFEDLPIDVQEKLLDKLGELGTSHATLLEDGYEIIGEEEMESQFTFGTLPTKSDAKPDLPTTETNGSFKILYKYKGPKDDKNRNFCRRLLDLDLLFRKEDINKMSLMGDNSQEFGYYDIFTYKGSFGCRHRWTKVYVYQSKNDPLGLIGALQDKDQSVNRLFKKEQFSTDGDKQMLTGPLLRPNKLIFRLDEENNPYFVYFSPETVKMIAEKMLKKGLLDKLNLEHDDEKPVDGHLVESWFITDPENDKQNSYGLNYEKGTWMGTYHISSKQIWDEYVKTGKVKGFSIQGFFDSRPVQ